jgi:hypothetical protein
MLALVHLAQQWVRSRLATVGMRKLHADVLRHSTRVVGVVVPSVGMSCPAVTTHVNNLAMRAFVELALSRLNRSAIAEKWKSHCLARRGMKRKKAMIGLDASTVGRFVVVFTTVVFTAANRIATLKMKQHLIAQDHPIL